MMLREGVATEPAPPWSAGADPAGSASRPRTDVAGDARSGFASSTVRAVTLVLFLNFDQFPRLIGRTFLFTAAGLALPLLLHEFSRRTTAARVVVGWILLLFGGLALPALLHWPEIDYGRQKVVLLMTLTLLSTLAVAIVRGRRDLRMFAWLLILSAVILAVAALTAGDSGGRSDGFGSNPIWLARAIGAALIAVAWLYFQRWLAMWLAASLTVLLSLGMFATGSRGPLVATVLGLFVLVLAGLRRKTARGKREWIGVTLMAGLVVTVMTLPRLLPPRMYALIVDPSDELFDSARAEMRQRTLSMIAEYRGGVGYGNWSDVSGLLSFNYPHNLWLELPAEAGWLVGGGFILATVVVAARLWGAARVDSAAGFVLGLLVFAVVAVSTSGDVNADRPLFTALALGILVLTWMRVKGRPGPQPSVLDGPAARPSPGDGVAGDGRQRPRRPVSGPGRSPGPPGTYPAEAAPLGRPAGTGGGRAAR
ncbi:MULTISPECIES: O-antigen ligase [Micromonospora]|uniref:O-antigen ligase-related domain-containing protein n=1 Tax=Micromonospora sicca TaxID=2202420 RepID=A0A317DK98_9ACTN|nr:MULTISPECIES: O-antigen ligase family protein [unclassified Micromonospora]MBM0225778.1 O-antigen ligase family protein [Micromonospora sp. ATA51]PWR13253.1 hypothetical protein DKT69_21495 [Micromonospora sp. 4G51]